MAKPRPAIKYRQLQYFLAVADTLHFSKAAESLFVTQPTLSHQLAELESQLGAVLFDRSGGVVRLTQAGEILRGYAQRSLDEIEQGCQALTELEDLQRGELRLGVTQSFIRHLMPPIVAKFSRQHPQIRVQILNLTAAQIERQLADGSIHLGIAFAPAVMEETQVEVILREQLLLLVRQDHALGGRDSVTWLQLGEHPLVLLSRSYSTRQTIDGFFADSAVEPLIVCETNTIELMINLVASAGWATILPESAVQHSRETRTVGIVDPTPVRTSALMWPKHRHRARAAIAFANIVKDQFSAGTYLEA